MDDNYDKLWLEGRGCVNGVGESPKWAQTGLPSLASSSCSRLHRAMGIGLNCSSLAQLRQRPGDEHCSIFIPLAAEGCSGPLLWYILEALLAPPYPISRPVPTERVEDKAGSTRIRREVCRAHSICSLPAVLHVLGSSFNQPCMCSTIVLSGQTSNWRSLVVG